MPLRFVPEPANGVAIVQAGLALRAAKPFEFERCLGDLSTVRLREAHPAYNLRADDIANGKGLESARGAGYRYLVEADGKVVASVVLDVDENGKPKRVSNVNYGPFVQATDVALQTLASDERVLAATYEVRILEFPAIYFMALWLKSTAKTGADIIYPFQASFGILAEQTYTVEEFLEAVRVVAQQRLADEKRLAEKKTNPPTK